MQASTKAARKDASKHCVDVVKEARCEWQSRGPSVDARGTRFGSTSARSEILKPEVVGSIASAQSLPSNRAHACR